MFWNEWNINFPIFPIFIFWDIAVQILRIFWKKFFFFHPKRCAMFWNGFCSQCDSFSIFSFWDMVDLDQNMVDRESQVSRTAVRLLTVFLKVDFPVFFTVWSRQQICAVIPSQFWTIKARLSHLPGCNLYSDPAYSRPRGRPLSIMGARLKSPLKPLKHYSSMVPGGWIGGPLISHHYAERREPHGRPICTISQSGLTALIRGLEFKNLE